MLRIEQKQITELTSLQIEDQSPVMRADDLYDLDVLRKRVDERLVVALDREREYAAIKTMSKTADGPGFRQEFGRRMFDLQYLGYSKETGEEYTDIENELILMHLLSEFGRLTPSKILADEDIKKQFVTKGFMTAYHLIRETDAKEKNLWLKDIKDLYRLPANIAKMVNLIYLCLADNNLQSLPVQIVGLTKLYDLHAGENKIRSLPLEFEHLVSLRTMSFGHNKMSTLPNGFGNFTHLRSVDLNHNEFTEFPVEVLNAPNLQILGLYANKISTIPKEISTAANLEYLDLGNTKISLIPNGIKDIKKLKKFSINSNKLDDVPDFFWTLDNKDIMNHFYLSGKMDVVLFATKLKDKATLEMRRQGAVEALRQGGNTQVMVDVILRLSKM